ncbi:MAG: HAMP domain-containing protein, partial [Planctomycetes bacterium]|nr:HAMP domain-containing protein [Planctomycetota bacterium]
MARRLILNICIFMLLVCALLTLLIVLDAAARLKSEERRHAELVASLMTDWVQGAQELEQAPNWPEVDRRLSSSALIESWVIVSRRAEDGSLAIETAQPSPQELGADAARLREVLEQGRLITSGGRVYAPIGGLRSTYAARFDLRAPVAGAAPILSGLGGLVAVMALGTALVVLNAYILLNRWVLRPMQSLVEASRRVSEGDFSKKIPPRATADEMAELVNAFNLMLEKIARHQATLVDDVR